MKKTVKKFRLHRETLLSLEEGNLAEAPGGLTQTCGHVFRNSQCFCGTDSCVSCTSCVCQ